VIVFAVVWLMARATGLGAQEKIRTISFWVVGLSCIFIAIHAAMFRSYLAIPPAIGAVYFLTRGMRDFPLSK
jgi:hypothetical protein